MAAYLIKHPLCVTNATLSERISEMGWGMWVGVIGYPGDGDSGVDRLWLVHRT